jgi:hypothetical protein
MQPIVARWKAIVPDVYGVPHTFTFHLAAPEIPLLIGNDVLARSQIHMDKTPFHINLHEPSAHVVFPLYTASRRTRIELVPVARILAALAPECKLTNACFAQEIANNCCADFPSPLALAKRLHAYSHAPVRDLRRPIFLPLWH